MLQKDEYMINEKTLIDRKNKKMVCLITCGTYFAFFTFGFVDNIKGAVLPVLLDSLNFRYSAGGTILTGSYIGFFIATLFAGVLSDLTGKKQVILLAGAALVIGITFFSSFISFRMLFISMLVLGFGLGSLELGCNSIIAEIYEKNKGKYLNLLSFFHSFGSTVAPYYVGKMLVSGFSWQSIYRFSLIIVIILPLFFLFVRYPKKSSNPMENFQIKEVAKALFNKKTLWFYLFVTAYCAAEIGMGSWLVEYLQSVKGQSVTTSTTFLSVFFGCLMVGRLIGSLIVDRIGYLKIMIICSSIATLCIIVGVINSVALTFFLPITGLFFSLLFPTATAAIASFSIRNKGIAMGIFFSCAGIGSIIGPWFIGYISESIGIGLGFSSVLIFCGVMIIALFTMLRRKGENSNI